MCQTDKVPPRLLASTITGQRCPSSFPGSERSLFKTNKEMILINGDTCSVGAFVIAHKPGRIGETYVARVDEIIQLQGSSADLSQQPDGVLLQPARVYREAPSYRMPIIELSYTWDLVRTKAYQTLYHVGAFTNFILQDLLCTVNIQHNCALNNCGATGQRPVYQEHQRTEHTRPVISHNRCPDDLMLNTAQMRDAVYVQPFRISSETLDLDDIVHNSALHELTALKASEPAAEVSAVGDKQAVTAGSRSRPAPRRVANLAGHS